MGDELQRFTDALDRLKRLQQAVLQNEGRPSAEAIAAAIETVLQALYPLLPLEPGVLPSAGEERTDGHTRTESDQGQGGGSVAGAGDSVEVVADEVR